MKNLILFCFLMLKLEGFAQRINCLYYDKYIRIGDSIFNKGDKANFGSAINAYSTAMLHCPDSAQGVRKKIQDVFTEIENLKTTAQKAEKIARKALAETEKANLVANKQEKMALVSQLTAESEIILIKNPSKIEGSVLLALKSMQVNYTPEAEEVLRKSLSLLSRHVLNLSHKGSVTEMPMSDDNKYLAIANNKTAFVWDIKTGKAIFTAEHDTIVNFVTIDSHSKYLATRSSDGTVLVWELKSRKEIYRFKNQSKIKEQNPVSIQTSTSDIRRRMSRLNQKKNELTFSQNGRYLAIASKDSAIHLIDMSSLETRFILKSSSPVNDIKFSPNGEFIAGKTGSIINVWDVLSGEQKFQIHLKNDVEHFAFDPRGRYLATITTKDTNEIAALWHVRTGQKFAKFGEPAEKEWGFLVGFSPDGKFLWTSTNIGTVTKWKVDTQREVFEIQNNHFYREVFSISSDGKYIATAGAGNMARLWNASDGSEVARFIHEDPISSIAFIDSSKYLAAATINGGVKIWETQNVNPVAKFNHSYLEKISFSDDEKFLLMYGRDVRNINALNIWSIPEKAKMFHKNKSGGSAYEAVISNNGKFLYSTSKDSLWKYDLETGDILSKIKLEGNDIQNADYNNLVTFSPNGDYLIKTINGRGILWKIDTGSRIMRLKLPENILIASFSPCSSLLVVSSEDPSTVSSKNTLKNVIVEVFDLGKSQSIANWRYPSFPFFALSYDDKFIAIPDMDTIKKDENNSTAIPTSTAKVIKLKDKTVFKSVEFPRDFNFMASGNELTALAFSPDGNYLMGGQVNGNASVFNIQNSNEVARVNNLSGNTITQVLFSHGRNYIATAEGNSSAQVWLWRQDDLIKAACSLLTRNFTFDEWKRYFGEMPYKRVCENLPPHPSLLKEAERLARSGDIDGAVAIIKMDVSLRDSLKMDPMKWAMEQAAKGEAPRLLRQGLNLAREGSIKEAVEAFSKAQKLDPSIKISAGNWNNLAWYGAIRNQAALVTEAINHALKLSPDNGAYRDTRGVIRALTGDFKGAKEDFEYYVNWGTNNGETRNDISKRKIWIEELSAGRNPLGPDTLKGLITPF